MSDNATTVRCETCGRTQQVDPSACLRQGWPTCCGVTMTWLGTAEDMEKAADKAFAPIGEMLRRLR